MDSTQYCSHVLLPSTLRASAPLRDVSLLPPGPLSQSYGANPGRLSDEIPVTASQQPPSWIYEVFFISAAHCLSPNVRSPSKEASSPFLECALSSLFAHASHRLDSSLGPSHPQVFAYIFLKPL